MYNILYIFCCTSDERESGKLITEQNQNLCLCFFVPIFGFSFLRIPPRNIPQTTQSSLSATRTVFLKLACGSKQYLVNIKI